MGISEATLQRFAQLQRMVLLAGATADGLRPDFDHQRQEVGRLSGKLGELRSRYGEVTVGPNGEAFIATTRKLVRNNSGHKVESYGVTDERREDLDGFTKPVFVAQQRLAAVREQQAKASEAAAAYRRVVAEARAALHDAGWREEQY